MKVSTVWKEKMYFVSEAGGHEVPQDAKTPIGEGKAMTPKELVVVGLSGCTAMDVAALMKKHKQPVESFDIQAEVNMTSGGHPVVFQDVLLTFNFKGALDHEKVVESVRLSQTKYCGVSAMMSKAVPVRYKIVINGEQVAEGQADFGG